MPRQFLFKRLCVAVLLVVPAVSEDCQSLLSIQSASNLTTKHIQYVRNGLCNPVGEQGSTKVRDNFLDFSGWKGATLAEVKFEPIWYSITHGQPVPEHCFIDDEVDKPSPTASSSFVADMDRRRWPKTFRRTPSTAAFWLLHIAEKKKSYHVSAESLGLRVHCESWSVAQRSRHFKRPIGLAIAEPEVQVISLCDKEQGPGRLVPKMPQLYAALIRAAVWDCIFVGVFVAQLVDLANLPFLEGIDNGHYLPCWADKSVAKYLSKTTGPLTVARAQAQAGLGPSPAP
eukprot:Skav230960  [mRNA]  locus=scaffold1214:42537:63811:+ [translate_table: standard]